MKSNKFFCALTALCGAVLSAAACGPFFPSTLLSGGDEPILAAPIASFSNELQRIELSPAKFQAKPATNGYFEQTLAAEISDLRKALGKQISWRERDLILKRYQKEREKLMLKIEAKSELANNEGVTAEAISNKRSASQKIQIAEGLPAEFVEYFRGFIAFHEGEIESARRTWKALLERPVQERRFRSTWAAYMLGRSYGDSDEALKFYEQVRALAREGCEDSLGLAAASVGWEARIALKKNELLRAMELYLEQLASGDKTAVNSLAAVANKTLEKPEPNFLRKVAAHPKAQRVITAYVISRGRSQPERYDGELEKDAASAWLEAVESAGIKDMASAERLALAAYQNGNMEQTERWLKRASATSPVAQWLRAKLLMRQGEFDKASALLAKISKFFPTGAGTNGPGNLEQDLWFEDGSFGGKQIRAEHGVLQLQRREYVQSLDTLLKAGFWMDGAYVAESVLTPDELKNYVDRNWPEQKKTADTDEYAVRRNEGSPAEIAEKIRHLLARRLTRINRGNEARPYFPTEFRETFDTLISALDKGWDETAAASERAEQLWKAAKIMREKGMELAGTETAPDFFVWDGGYEFGPGLQTRTNEQTVIFKASRDEIRRAREHAADPDLRFHYRYIAADLAWHAAQLMPDNSDEIAVVLCTAGSWIKYQNPDAADRYYKALVRRCRQTEIGAEADRMRWFPLLDENGKLRKKSPVIAPDSPEN